MAREHHISIHWKNGRGWMDKAHTTTSAAADLSIAVIPRPNNARQFLVAMHEFGHILGPLPRSERLSHHWTPGEWELIEEAAAWGWAMEHIPDDLDRAITELDFEKTVNHCFGTHAWSVAHTARHGSAGAS